MDAVFTFLRQLATRTPVIDVAAPKWLIQRHGLAPLAARAGVSAFRDDLVRATVEWAQVEQDVPRVVAGLRAAGVEPALLKGAAYAKGLYAHPAERPMGDVDVLVREERMDPARRALAAMGFVRGPTAALHHAEPWTRGTLAVDLHRDIIAPGRSQIDLHSVWNRAVPAPWPDGALALESADQLVFHLVHLARNRLRLPLINVVDAARLFERADVDVALERARSWGLGWAVSLAHRFCVSLIENRPGTPAGRLGPSRTEVALMSPESVLDKVLFEIAMAGSPAQLRARAIHFGANRLRGHRRQSS